MPEPDTSIDRVQAEIIREMAGLHDPIARYRYLVAQGDALPPADADLRSERHLVAGCQASVWIRADLCNGRLHLAADSDARINRGIVALLVRVLDRRTPAEILAADLFFLDHTGLRADLSPVRANGLGAMVRRILACAREHAPAPA